MSPADNMPDFDKMSPEEIMAWMETLAKRQGAKMEELTTEADVEIAEIDPDTVVIDEPGYVPYGQERPPKPEPSAPPARQPAAPPPPAAASAPPPRQPAAPPPAPARSAQQPLPEPPQQPAAAQPTQQPLPEPERPAASLPSVEVPALPQMDESEDEFDTKVTASGAADAMAWLESLAADQSDDLFNIDLSALSEELAGAAPESSQVNPVDWLESLTETQGEAPAPVEAPKAEAASPWQAPAPQAEPEQPAETEVADPFAAGVDPMAWLEELARRQGANSEELVTNTRMNIPVPKDAVIDEPGYKPYSPDAPFKSSKPAREPEPEPEPLQLESPTDWLSSLADSQGFDEGAIGQKEAPEAQAPEEMTLEDIERAIAAGTVSPEQMQYYLEHQTDRYIETMEGAPDETKEEAPPVPAEIPDWLLEQVGAPPATPQEAQESTLPPLIDEIQQPPDVLDMPDWLKEDATADSGLDFNIFEDETPEPEPAPSTPVFENITLNYTVEVDPNDPWVEAFDQEHELGRADINNVPDWYTKNLSDPERIAAVEAIVRGEAEATEELADAALPEETELPPGEPEAIPDWLLESAPDIAAEPTPAADIPDWLREMEVAVEPDVIPDWLMEPLGEDESVIFEPEPEPAPPVMQQPPEPAPAPVKPATPPPPAPKPAPAPVNLSATLENARALAKAGNVNESLAEYESLIRANRELQFVVDDLTSLVKVEKNNPAVYRVLGDGLMRQGKLQAALDIYREALNQL